MSTNTPSGSAPDPASGPPQSVVGVQPATEPKATEDKTLSTLLFDRLWLWLKGQLFVFWQKHLLPLLVGLFLGGAVGLGFVYPTTFPTPPKDHPMKTPFATPGLQRLCEKAEQFGRPYALISVTQIVELSDSINGESGASERIANFRLTYVILACKDIVPDPSESDTINLKSFIESIQTTWGILQRWPGTEIEGGSRGSREYPVNIGYMEKGEVKTIVTGANIKYKLPLPERTFDGNITCNPNQDFYSYPNNEDVIGEIKIIISSDTTYLLPANNNPLAAKYIRSGAAHPHSVRAGLVGDLPAERSLSATFFDVVPAQEVGIHFQWAPNSALPPSMPAPQPKPVKAKKTLGS